MKKMMAGVGVLLIMAVGLGGQKPEPRKGVALSELAWPDAEPWLTASAVVVLPLGAGAVEQGPHMKLDSEARLAHYLTGRVMQASAIVVAPPLNYHSYPAYADYPGSSSLSDAAARDLVVDAARSLARTGPRRFYVLNTSPSTVGPLSAAAKTLADAGILLGYTDPEYWLKQPGVLKQAPVSAAHADEAVTSMMLFVDPAAVDMSRARREYPERGARSQSGTYGDATLATAQKGEALVSALLAGILADVEKVRAEALPSARTTPAAPPTPAPPRPAERQEPRTPFGCTVSDDRAIRNIALSFSYAWSQEDAESIARMFTPNGDIRHPDGSIERGRNVILENRTQLFMRREYNGSRHPLQLNDVRCLSGANALADGKWELRLQDDPQKAPGRGLAATKSNSGYLTLVLVKTEGGWSIDAWRYTINPPEGAPQPTLLAKPGYVGRGGP
jgi:creatinine amidohydrolase